MPSVSSLPFRLLRHRDFALFFYGTFVSMIGMGIHLIGVNWYILQTTGAETKVSLIMMTSLSAGLFILPFSGSIIDRHARRTMVILPDVVRGTIVLTVGLFALSADFPIWVLWPMAFVVGSGHAFYFPASSALLQEILPPEEYMNANSLREITFQVGSLAAAGVAGWVVATFGISGVLIFDATTYFFSAFCVSRIHSGRVPHPERDTSATYWSTIKSGLRYLMDNRAIFIFGIIAMMPFVTVMALNVLMPTFVHNTLQRGPVTYGLLDMMYGLGAFTGAAIIGSLVIGKHEKDTLRLFLASLAAGYLVFAFTSHIAIAFGISIVIGFLVASFRIVSQTYLMKVIPGPLMGRCTSTFFQISLIVQLSMIFGVGYAAEHVSIGSGFILLTLLLTGALIHFWFLRHRLPEPAAAEVVDA